MQQYQGHRRNENGGVGRELQKGEERKKLKGKYREHIEQELRVWVKAGR